MENQNTSLSATAYTLIFIGLVVLTLISTATEHVKFGLCQYAFCGWLSNCECHWW